MLCAGTITNQWQLTTVTFDEERRKSRREWKTETRKTKIEMGRYGKGSGEVRVRHQKMG